MSATQTTKVYLENACNEFLKCLYSRENKNRIYDIFVRMKEMNIVTCEICTSKWGFPNCLIIRNGTINSEALFVSVDKKVPSLFS